MKRAWYLWFPWQPLSDWKMPGEWRRKQLGGLCNSSPRGGEETVKQQQPGEAVWRQILSFNQPAKVLRGIDDVGDTRGAARHGMPGFQEAPWSDRKLFSLCSPAAKASSGGSGTDSSTEFQVEAKPSVHRNGVL